MSVKQTSLRSPLGTVRGLGSAHNGTHHSMVVRATALALVPLAFYVLIGFFNTAVAGGYSGAEQWLQSPLAATFTILFLLTGLRHGTLGMQVVFEDYVQCRCARASLIFGTNFVAAALAILGTLSVAKIFFAV